MMRTTLTLDDDVARRLRRHCRQADQSFKQAVNTLLRRALAESEEPKTAEPFKVKARPMGLRPGFNLDNVGEVLERLDRR